MKQRVCKTCRNKFRPTRSDAEFCSSQCRQAAYRVRKKDASTEGRWQKLREVVGLLYVALASAAGGDELLHDSNRLLRDAVEAGAIANPETRNAIMALARDSSPETLHRLLRT